MTPSSIRRASIVSCLAALLGCASRGPSPLLSLRRVVLNQSGSGYFERTGRVAGDRLALRLRAHEVDDVLATLTVLERGDHARQTVVAAGVPHAAPNAREEAVNLDLRLPDERPRDLMVSYAVPTANWQATYRVVLPERDGAPALVQVWALLHNSSDEDWNHVEMTLATGAPLSFAFHLRTPSFTARPDASGRLVSPVVNAPVVSEQSGGQRQMEETRREIADGRWSDADREAGNHRNTGGDAGGRADGDVDHDGLPDADDRCPDSPENYNGSDDTDGCPDQGRVAVEGAQIRILHRVEFDAGSAQIPARATPIVESITAVLRAQPAITLIELQGNASGEEEDGWGLALARAAAVRARLAQMGIEASRMRTRSFGASRPLAPGDAPAARARNRAVDFHIVDTASATTPATSTGITARALSASASPEASTQEFAGATRFTVAEPVSIAAGSAALVTLASREVPGEDVYLFRPEAAAPASREHPYRAARIRNAMGLTLLPGPVALFAGGTFAGEGLLERLNDGETTFIPYAIDPSTTVRSAAEERREPRRVVSAARTELVLEDTAVVATRFTVRPGAQAPSRVFLRYGHLPGYEPRGLPPESEAGREATLVPVPLTARQESAVTLEQTRPARRTVSLLDDLATDVAPYLAGSSEEMRRRLAPVLDQRAALGRAELQAESLREQLSDVADRNAELRETLRTLGAATDAARVALRAQLTRQLAESMARHAALSRDLAARGAEAAALRAQLVDALRGLRYDEEAAGATPGRASTS